MELKGRLKLIADKTPKCDMLADIGTDHGYLPIYLKSKNLCKRAIAADVKKGPLKAAENNIKEYGLDEYIETRLGDGLAPLKAKEADVIVIAGMGGILIKDILKAGIEVAAAAGTLILQPMNAMEILRQWIFENGFEIIDEELIMEGDKIYVVLSVKWTGETLSVNEFNFYIGIRLIEKKDPLLKDYINKWIPKLKKALIEMEASDSKVEPIREKYIWLINSMNEVLEKL